MATFDEIWPNNPTGPDGHEQQRDELEQRDADSILNEQAEQQRIGESMIDPFSHNRVEIPGTGDGAGGRVRINPDHWGE